MAFLVCAGALIAAAIAVSVAASDTPKPAEVQRIFEEPDSFCEAWRSKPLTERVGDVEAARAEQRAVRAVVTLTHEFLERLARLPDTPEELRVPIERLADQVDRTEPEALATAERDASRVDRSARARCA